MYTVVIGRSRLYEKFVQECHQKVVEGYVPTGGLSIKGDELFQAFYKPSEAPVLQSKETSPQSNTRGRGRPRKEPTSE